MMAILAAVHHLTHYKYDRPVVLGPQVIRLQPAPHSRTKVLSHSLKVAPAKHFVNRAAGPLRQFPGALRLSRAGDGAEDRGRSRRRHDGLQSVRLLRGAVGGEFALRLSRGHRRRSRRSTGRRSRPGRCSTAFLSRVDRSHTNTVNFIVALNAQVQREIGYIIRMETGVMTPEETLAAGKGLVPRFELAAGAGAAESRHRRALRLRLPDPAEARPRRARRAGRHRGRFHRPARLVRGLSARRRLDRARPDLGPADRREPCAAGRDAALPQRRADLRHGELRQCRLRLRHARRPRRRASAHHQAVLGRELAGARPAGRRGRRGAEAGGRAADHGRRADLRVDRRFRERGMEHRRGRADQAREGRRADPAAARALRAERLPALRPGQVVSGREPAALDLLALLAHRRRAGLVGPRADRAGEVGRQGHGGGRRQAADHDRRRARHRHRDGRRGL